MGLSHLRRNEPLLAGEGVLECPSLWGCGRHLGRAVCLLLQALEPQERVM